MWFWDPQIKLIRHIIGRTPRIAIWRPGARKKQWFWDPQIKWIQQIVGGTPRIAIWRPGARLKQWFWNPQPKRVPARSADLSVKVILFNDNQSKNGNPGMTIRQAGGWRVLKHHYLDHSTRGQCKPKPIMVLVTEDSSLVLRMEWKGGRIAFEMLGGNLGFRV